MESIDISFQYDNTRSDQALLELWKITNNTLVCSSLTSAQRLNNRSWRLLNKKFLLTKNIQPHSMDDLSKDSLSALRPNESQFLSDTKRPSTSDKHSFSRPSLFSHSSNLSLSSNKKSTNNSSFDSDPTKNSVSSYGNGENGYYEEDDLDDDSDISDISEEGENENEDDETEVPMSNTIENSLSPLHPQAINRASPAKSTNSFVRGFSPNHVSISRTSSLSRAAVDRSRSSTSSLGARKDSHAGPKGSKNIFYIANSPSPPEGQKSKRTTNNKDDSHSPQSECECSQTESSSNSPGKIQTRIQRQDSLFSNYQMKFKDDKVPEDVKQVLPNIITTQLDETTKGNNNEDGYSSTDISEDEDEEDDFFEEDDVKLDLDEKPTRIIADDITNDNDSEWLSVSSEDDKSNMNDEPLHPLQFSKITTSEVSKSASNTSVATDIQGSSEMGSFNLKRYSSSAVASKPRSLLSGLFLNELGNQQESPQKSKPVLKRSSTTGVITFDQNRSQLATSSSKRPYILFSKKYSSLSDISKNYPHYQNELVEKDILDERMRLIKTPVDEVSGDAEDDDSLIGKQKSMVGISDFNVIAKSSTSNDGESFKDLPRERLSTSLNKFSGSVLGGYMPGTPSIRSIMSKSSINLGKLYKNSKSVFGRSDQSISERNENERPERKKAEFGFEPPVVDIPADVQTKPKSGSPHSTSAPIATTPNLNGHIHGFTRRQSTIKRDEIENDKGQNIRLSPDTTRRSMLSTELSESLKQSIIIDYKLGKVPLPQRVISETFRPNAGLVGVDDESDFDDYHSKGW